MLLTLAGLLEFPADQNFIDGLWSMALKALRLPADLPQRGPRAASPRRITTLSNYYGSRRGLRSSWRRSRRAIPSRFEQLGSEDRSWGGSGIDLSAEEKPED